MLKINQNFLKLKSAYLFSEIAKRREAFKQANPGARLISLGIGDVTRPLAPAVVAALDKAVSEMGTVQGFRGYAPEQGYAFLREAVCASDMNGLGIAPDEIFISDGAKSDMGNVCDIFDANNTVAVIDPVYPVYVDTSVMSGRNVVFVSATAANGFAPAPPSDLQADIIYICSPNNPTGTVMSRATLTEWVNYALGRGAVILFDAAYEAFITESGLPRSIYEIPGAHECAIEFRTFSKTAGFTGLRCGYSVVPKTLVCGGVRLFDLWFRRYATKFNGVPYIVQRAAEAVCSEEGRRQTRADIAYYLENAQLIKSTLTALGHTCYGGDNSPYVWFDCGRPSWEYFDALLSGAAIVCTPGAGFGACGEGWARMTAFGTRENTLEACERVKSLRL